LLTGRFLLMLLFHFIQLFVKTLKEAGEIPLLQEELLVYL
jgi:hypothetical protein